MNKLRIARIYAERVYRSKHSVDNRCHREKTPLMSIEPGRETLYAKTMVIAAQISYAHGHMREAIRELNEAHRLEPLDHSGEQLLAKVTEHREVLQKRDDARYEGWVLQLQKEHEKVASEWTMSLEQAT